MGRGGAESRPAKVCQPMTDIRQLDPVEGLHDHSEGLFAAEVGLSSLDKMGNAFFEVFADEATRHLRICG